MYTRTVRYRKPALPYQINKLVLLKQTILVVTSQLLCSETTSRLDYYHMASNIDALEFKVHPVFNVGFKGKN